MQNNSVKLAYSYDSLLSENSYFGHRETVSIIFSLAHTQNTQHLYISDPKPSVTTPLRDCNFLQEAQLSQTDHTRRSI